MHTAPDIFGLFLLLLLLSHLSGVLVSVCLYVKKIMQKFSSNPHETSDYELLLWEESIKSEVNPTQKWLNGSH